MARRKSQPRIESLGVDAGFVGEQFDHLAALAARFHDGPLHQLLADPAAAALGGDANVLDQAARGALRAQSRQDAELQAADHGAVTIFGDGEQTRDFLFVDDVVDAFVRGATRGGGLLLNVGTGRELSVNELARVMSEVAGSTTPPAYAPARPGELQRSALDPERAGIHLGWTAWTDLPRGVQSVLDHVRGRIAD